MSTRKKECLNEEEVAPPGESVKPGIERFSLEHHPESGDEENEWCTHQQESGSGSLRNREHLELLLRH
jgi:hypothetical protein